jgi:hypothetical protein
MSLTLADLYASPDHYLHSFDGDAAIFVPMDRAAYHRSIFLDGRISPAGEGEMRVPLSLFAQGAQPRRTGWIFHVAHCGSTLLARALDQPSSNLVLREPLALRQCAVAPGPGRLALTAAMVSKRYDVDLPTVVKANVPVNFILPELIALDRTAPAIFLYLPLRDYLLAILRSDTHREWLGRVTTQLAPYLGDLAHLSDAERASALWLTMMRAFARATAIMPNARTLDAEQFFADPASVLAAAAALFAIDMDRAAIERCVAGPLFATYSKNPSQSFDNQARIARRAALEASLADDLAQAERWLQPVAEERTALEAEIRGATLAG